MSGYYSSLRHEVRHGPRAYQATILFLLVSFGSYIVSSQPGMRIDDAHRMRTVEESHAFNARVGDGPSGVDAQGRRCECAGDANRASALATSSSDAGLDAENSKQRSAQLLARTTSLLAVEGEEGDVASTARLAAAIAVCLKGVTSAGVDQSIVPRLQYGVVPTVTPDGSYMQFVRAAYPPVGPEIGSPLFGDYFETPISYGSPTSPAVILSGHAASAAAALTVSQPLRPACQRDTDLLQSFIYANQHPTDCRTARLFVRRYMPLYGLFAGLGHGANYIFLATIVGRTLVDLSANTYFTGNCAKNNAECAFLPVTSCTEHDFEEEEVCYTKACFETARVISLDRTILNDYLPCAPTEFPHGRCNLYGGPLITRSLHQLIPSLKAHGEQWLQQEFSRFQTRPNPALASYTANEMRQHALTAEIIGVHIRHGDKQEGMQFPTAAYALVVKRAIQITGIKVVFIGSDDLRVYDELPTMVNLQGIRYAWLNTSVNPIVFSAAEARDRGNNTIGMSLMAQTIIFAQASVYIGTRTSNAGQLVYALAGADCTREPKIAYDMYGDLFYNSWYCRRDIVHAGREWMCALTPPAEEPTVKGKRKNLIWGFGGARTQCSKATLGET
jgi:hypothetical protein